MNCFTGLRRIFQNVTQETKKILENLFYCVKHFIMKCVYLDTMQDSIKTSTTNDAANKTTAVATSSSTSLPTDLAGCYALIAQLSAVVAEAKVARDAQQSEIDSLKAYVDELLARLYGQRSEKLKVDPNQQQLDFGDDPAAKDALAEAAAEAEKIIQVSAGA